MAELNLSSVDQENNAIKNKESVEDKETDSDNEQTHNNNEKRSIWKDLEGDRMHVLVLFFLYILQGIPLGLINSIPLELSNRNVPYKDQATFSLSSYPFSMKLLWAPLVDSVYLPAFGRRKSWLVPVQYLIGVLMLIASQRVGFMLGDSSDPDVKIEPNIAGLTALFFILNFLAATQDVAVDGWALTMLAPKNVGYASTCNSVGQTTGWVLGFILYTTLEGKGILTLGDFLLFWGIVFLITTTFILFFKKEKNASFGYSLFKTCNKTTEATPLKEAGEKISTNEETSEPDLTLIQTYKIIFKMIKHHLIPVVIFFLLTHAISFSAVEALTQLKMIERGVPKDKIAMLAIPMIPVKIGFTLLITRFTTGPRPMNVWLISYPIRLIFCLALVLCVYVTPLFAYEVEGVTTFSTGYYALVIGVMALHRVALYAMFVAIMAFFARISDPAIGGTYMTFLNTLTNLGNMWPNSLFLWMVDLVTWKSCDIKEASGSDGTPIGSLTKNITSLSEIDLTGNVCYGTAQVEACEGANRECNTLSDGFFGLGIVTVLFGFVWFVWALRTMRKLQEVEVMEWRLTKTDTKEEKGPEKTKYNFFLCF